MKKWLKKYWHWVVVTAIFLSLVLFRSSLTLVDLVRTRASVWRLHREIERYDKQIQEDSIYVERLKGDAFLEKYGRQMDLYCAAMERVFGIRVAEKAFFLTKTREFIRYESGIRSI